jgi:bifunctional enzyme CysN/CysC
VLKAGDTVTVLPSGLETKIEKIETADGPVDEAFPPMAVTVSLADHLDISRGDMLCRPHNMPTVAQEIDAQVCWMDESAPMAKGGKYAIKHTTRSARALVRDLHYRLDVNSLSRDETSGTLQMNDMGRVSLRVTMPLFVDEYRRNRTTGSFILVDEATNDTVGAGMIVETITNGGSPADASGRSPNVVWHEGGLTREERWRTLGQRGATVWRRRTALAAASRSSRRLAPIVSTASL